MVGGGWVVGGDGDDEDEDPNVQLTLLFFPYTWISPVVGCCRVVSDSLCELPSFHFLPWAPIIPQSSAYGASRGPDFF